MVGRDIAHLLNRVHGNGTPKDEAALKRALASKLDINIKTLNSWMSDKADAKIGRPYVAYLRRFFEPILIREKLHAIEESAFTIAPSECICFWIVCGTEVILLKDSVRNELLPQQYKFHNDEIHKLLSDDSMTVDSIQETKVINTYGEEINHHKKKDFPHILTYLLSGGMCHSLLKVPVVIRSAIGPRVIGLLDLQNKLEKKPDGSRKPIQEQKGQRSTDSIYTEGEVISLRDMVLTEYNTDLKVIMDALDYLDPATSPQQIEGCLPLD